MRPEVLAEATAKVIRELFVSRDKKIEAQIQDLRNTVATLQSSVHELLKQKSQAASLVDASGVPYIDYPVDDSRH